VKKLILLLGILSVFILAGCEKSNKAEVGTPENPYHIIWYNTAYDIKDLSKVMKKASEYTRKKIGVTVEMKIQTVDYNQKMNILESSGEPFDICFTAAWTNDYRIAGKKGYLIPLNDLMNKYAKETIDDLDPLFIKGTAIEGVNYGIPVNKEMAYQHVFMFNKRLLDKYNLKVGKSITWSELDKMFEFIKKKEPGISVFNPWAYYVMQDQDYILGPNIPGAVLIKKGHPKVINQFLTKNFRNQMNWYRKFYKKGYIPAKAIFNDSNGTVDLKTGNFFCSINSFSPGGNEVFSRELGLPIVSVPMFQKPIVGSMSLSGAMIGISSTCERPDLAMKFINLLNTDVYLRNLIGYGIEGIHYKKIGKNTIKLLPKAKDYSQFQFTLGNMFITYLLANDPPNKWELYKKWNKSAVVSPLVGFSFDSDPVKTELAAINNISKEFNLRIMLGGADPDIYVDKMLDKMKDAGLNKIMAEEQKQIDEWWSKEQLTNKSE
jgi:putative aldouronate transport system substrate-binding protein